MSSSRIALSIKPSKILSRLLFLLFTLLILNISGIILKFTYENLYVENIVEFFDFDSEDSLPTVFSYLLLLTSSVLLGLTALKMESKKEFYQWFALSMIFFLLSLDEIMSIHENLIPILRNLKDFNFTGFLYFGWVLPYAFFLVLFALYYIPFLIRLPKSTAFYFCLSGILFVIGALGIEMFEAKHYEQYGSDSIFAVYYTIEEFLEMLGIIIFIYAILKYNFEDKAALFIFKLIEKE